MSKRREAQNKRLLRFLLRGHSISHRRADYILDITRLAARIRDLKDIGIKFEDKMEYVGDIKFKRYWLPKKLIVAYKQHQLLQA